MIDKISEIAQHALDVQNKLGMEGALKDIVLLCHELKSCLVEPEVQENPFHISAIDWKEIDTSLAENLTDENLLEQCSFSMIASGWGNIAELMKRFHVLTNTPSLPEESESESEENIISAAGNLNVEVQSAEVEQQEASEEAEKVNVKGKSNE